jgi:hypothetical protein
MPISTGDLSALSQAEIIDLRTEVRRWSMELRRGMAALVNSRMKGQISHVQYSADRKAALDERAECERSRELLNREMARRGM